MPNSGDLEARVAELESALRALAGQYSPVVDPVPDWGFGPPGGWWPRPVPRPRPGPIPWDPAPTDLARMGRGQLEALRDAIAIERKRLESMQTLVEGLIQPK
ncbi:MAG: hypothetical protein IT460_07340 [Planctomycetes bacterium]|nr:hypothetical protein [Planctomycetota bacterium]